MSQSDTLLAELRDIQLPPAPEGVSLWLLGANVLLVVVALLALYTRWRRRRERWRREALATVKQAAQMEPAGGVLELAKLLRQLMLHRQYDISSTGRPWLQQLDAAFNTRWFSQSRGQAFGPALYQQSLTSKAELQVLCKELERLIRTLPCQAVRQTLPPEANQPSST